MKSSLHPAPCTLLLAILLLHSISLRGQQYVPPQVPDTVADLDARVSYATAHYWETFNFADTTLLSHDYGEQALVDFIGLLSYASPEMRETAVGKWMETMEPHPKAYVYFVQEAEEYLYRPESPLQDEALYQLVLQQVVRQGAASEARMERARFQLRLLSRNHTGDKATDFRYLRADGLEASLAETAPDRPLLLVFYDPECRHCRETIDRLASMSLLRQAINDGRLSVLAIYVEGDEQLWRGTRDELPVEWVVGMDLSGIRDNMLYDLKSMPTLYLLDADRRVTLKDATVPQILSSLIRL